MCRRLWHRDLTPNPPAWPVALEGLRRYGNDGAKIRTYFEMGEKKFCESVKKEAQLRFQDVVAARSVAAKGFSTSRIQRQ